MIPAKKTGKRSRIIYSSTFGLLLLTACFFIGDFLRRDGELLQRCQDNLNKNTAAESQMSQLVTALNDIQASLLLELQGKNQSTYDQVLSQVQNADDYLGLPTTNFDIPRGKSTWSQLRTCQANVKKQTETMRELELIRNETQRQNQLIKFKLNSHYPSLPAISRR